MEENIALNLRRRLLQWYRKHKRDLPWRRTTDPYAIWVSEVMLQQTQVTTVLPYYERFLTRFPTVSALAQAGEEEVLALWSGLGYYRRAKLLHRGAKTVEMQAHGRLPAQAEALKKIPGIGPYTAGAIASIAFQKAEPLVDGNVIRVFARLFALRGHSRDPRLQKKVWHLAGQMVQGKQPGDFNQGLMELGATVCRAVSPACERCPVAAFCRAKHLGKPEAFPENPPAEKIVRLTRAVAVCEREGKILLVKRREPRWFQGLWELPHDYVPVPEAAETSLKHFLHRSLGIRMKNPKKIPLTRHSITHHRIASHAWHAQITGRARPKQPLEMLDFFSIPQLKNTALSNFDRKVLKAGGLLKTEG